MPQSILLIPRSGRPRKIGLLLLGLLITIVLLVASALLAGYGAALKHHLRFAIPEGFWGLMLITTLVMVLVFLLAALVSAAHELVWVDDPHLDEIRLEDRYFGRPVFIRRYPSKTVAGIRVHWQESYLGGKPSTDSPGWWMAALVLWDGQSIHLHGTQSGPWELPADWLARFERASRLSGVTLQREPIPTAQSQHAPGRPPVAGIVSNLKRRR